MIRNTMLRYAVVTMALLAAGAAQADVRAGSRSETRASGAIPAPGQQDGSAVRGNPQGPKQGFPDNDGIRRAMERANEHARFHRHDSEG